MNERPGASREGRGLWAGKTMGAPRPAPVARYSRAWLVYSLVLLVVAVCWGGAWVVTGGPPRDLIAPAFLGWIAAFGAFAQWRLRRRGTQTPR